VSAAQIIEAARAGGAILTANQRLSRTLREQYDRAQAAAGLRAWESPAILPFSTWLASQWGDALLGGGVAPRTVLSAAQEESVWRTIVAASPDAQSLLDLRGAAQSAMEAWRLIQQYRVPLDARFNAGGPGRLPRVGGRVCAAVQGARLAGRGAVGRCGSSRVAGASGDSTGGLRRIHAAAGGCFKHPARFRLHGDRGGSGGHRGARSKAGLPGCRR